MAQPPTSVGLLLGTAVACVLALGAQGAATPAAGSGSSPVLLIPGDGGSQLEAKAHDKPSTKHFFCEKSFDWSTLWLSLPSLAPGLIDCWADNIQLGFDQDTVRCQAPSALGAAVRQAAPRHP